MSTVKGCWGGGFALSLSSWTPSNISVFHAIKKSLVLRAIFVCPVAAQGDWTAPRCVRLRCRWDWAGLGYTPRATSLCIIKSGWVRALSHPFALQASIRPHTRVIGRGVGHSCTWLQTDLSYVHCARVTLQGTDTLRDTHACPCVAGGERLIFALLASAAHPQADGGSSCGRI